MKMLALVSLMMAALVVSAAPEDLATEAYVQHITSNAVNAASATLDNKIDATATSGRTYADVKSASAVASAGVLVTNALDAAKAYTDNSLADFSEIITNVASDVAGVTVTQKVTKAYVEGLGIEVGINSNEVAKIATNVAHSITMDCPTDVTRNAHTATFVNTHNGKTNDLFVLERVNTVSNKAGLMTVEDKVALDNVLGVVENWEAYLGGSNVVFSITNYISGTYSPDHGKMRILELRDGEYGEIYDSRKEALVHVTNETQRLFGEVMGEIAATNIAFDAKLDAKADRAWGKYTSGGSEAESNTVYITAPTTVFGGGCEFERVNVNEGAIWVLTDKGAPVYTAGSEGTFKFQDLGGTNCFGFAKADSYMLGCDTDGIRVNSGIVFLTYNIIGAIPIIMYRASLTEGEWIQLNDSSGQPIAGAPVLVQWNEDPPEGTQEAYISTGARPSGFFTAQIEQVGGSKFFTNMEADFQGGLTCTNTATQTTGIIYPVYDGTSVRWEWRAR